MVRPGAERTGLLRPRVHVRRAPSGAVRLSQGHLDLDPLVVGGGEEQRGEKGEILQYGDTARVTGMEYQVGERGPGHQGVAAHDMVAQPRLGRAGQCGHRTAHARCPAR